MAEMEPSSSRDHLVVVPHLLARQAEERPDDTYAVFGDGSPPWTFADTARRAWGWAHALKGLGVGPGDRVAAWLPNGPEVITAWYGANVAGAVHVALNVAHRGAVLEHALNLSRARVLVGHGALLERLRGLSLPHLETVVACGGVEVDLPGVRVVPWAEVAAPAEAPPPVAPPAPWDDMALIFSSGTTGVSKAVRCSAIHHDAHQRATLPDWLGADERHLVALPLFHVGATGTVYGALARGASIAVIESFRTREFWADVARLQPTVSWVLAVMANFLLREPVRDDDADNPLRLVLMVPLIAEVEAFARRFGVDVLTCYGSTEVPPPLRSLVPAKPGSCGRPWSDEVETRIVDEHDVEVPPGQAGELVLRHRRPWAITAGYLDMPEATAAAWRNGWFHTGDRFRRDDDDDHFLLDRVKDTVRRRGEFISSVEVEREVVAHPAVGDAAVVGVPSDDGTGDEVMAFVTRDGPDELSLPDLVTFLSGRLAHFMVPRYIEVVPELPRTETTKVKKEELRRRGVSAATWDREAVGMVLRAERLGPRGQESRR